MELRAPLVLIGCSQEVGVVLLLFRHLSPRKVELGCEMVVPPVPVRIGCGEDLCLDSFFCRVLRDRAREASEEQVVSL